MTVLDKFRLAGKRALITGGTRGLGFSMARALAEAGADLVIVGSDAGNLDTAKRELSATGRRVEALRADLYLNAQTQAMCERALAEFAPIDILINNIGGRRQDIATEAMPLETWQRM